VGRLVVDVSYAVLLEELFFSVSYIIVSSLLGFGVGIWTFHVLTTLDAAHPLPRPRLKEVLSSVKPPGDADQPSSSVEPPMTSSLLKNLNHFTTPTLPHLIALLCHTIPSFPSQNTSLIIIDSLSVLVASAYPRTLDIVPTARKVGNGKPVIFQIFFYSQLLWLTCLSTQT
jgi:hypothetical protein